MDVLLIGPLPTPGVAYITRSLRADAGIVLSASHNPYEDNGIKFFRHDGYKLDDEIEQQIEQLVFTGEIDSDSADGEKDRPRHAASMTRSAATSSLRKRVFRAACRSRKCASRSMSRTAPATNRRRAFCASSARNVAVAHNQPNGTNINADCGSTYPEEIQRLVKESGAQVGITHDGDADRVLLCDEKGEIVDGDEILAIASVDLLRSRPAAAKHPRRHGDEQLRAGRSARGARRQSHSRRRSATAT